MAARLSAVVVGALLAIAIAVGSAAASVWPPRVSGFVASLSCAGADTCTAVGTQHVWRWNGTRWAQLPSWPKNIDVTLLGVSCSSQNACRIVGVAEAMAFCGYSPIGEPVGSPPAAFVARWSGSQWKFQELPAPGGGNPCNSETELDGVSCTSARACMAVGSTQMIDGGAVTLEAARWNGRSWTVEPMPTPTGGIASLSSVACRTAAECIAVGSVFQSDGTTAPVAEYWDGQQWTMQLVPQPAGATGGSTLAAVSCGSASACTAVGSYVEGGTTLALAERWNGSNWRIQRTPQPSGSSDIALLGVSCTVPRACTAVGHEGTHTPFAERWNGSKWAIQHMPTPARARQWSALPTTRNLSMPSASVSCGAANGCTAILDYTRTNSAGWGFSLTAAERWNGKRWAIEGFRFPILP